jgi:hypothetical protein
MEVRGSLRMAIIYHTLSHVPEGRVPCPHSTRVLRKEKIYISRLVSRLVSDWGTRFTTVPKGDSAKGKMLYKQMYRKRKGRFVSNALDYCVCMRMRLPLPRLRKETVSHITRNAEIQFPPEKGTRFPCSKKPAVSQLQSLAGCRPLSLA